MDIIEINNQYNFRCDGRTWCKKNFYNSSFFLDPLQNEAVGLHNVNYILNINIDGSSSYNKHFYIRMFCFNSKCVIKYIFLKIYQIHFSPGKKKQLSMREDLTVFLTLRLQVTPFGVLKMVQFWKWVHFKGL